MKIRIGKTPKDKYRNLLSVFIFFSVFQTLIGLWIQWTFGDRTNLEEQFICRADSNCPRLQFGSILLWIGLNIALWVSLLYSVFFKFPKNSNLLANGALYSWPFLSVGLYSNQWVGTFSETDTEKFSFLMSFLYGGLAAMFYVWGMTTMIYVMVLFFTNFMLPLLGATYPHFEKDLRLIGARVEKLRRDDPD